MSQIIEIPPHRLRHGDIADPEISDFLGTTPAGIMYTDPPWGTSLVKYFDTLSRKQAPDAYTPARLKHIAPFLTRLLWLARKHVRGWVVIEYGQHSDGDVVTFAEQQWLSLCGHVRTRYTSKYFTDVWVFHTEGKQAVDLTPARDLAGVASVRAIFDVLQPKGHVIDLCCGKGQTAQVAAERGLTFIGNELNLLRLEETARRLRRITGC